MLADSEEPNNGGYRNGGSKHGEPTTTTMTVIFATCQSCLVAFSSHGALAIALAVFDAIVPLMEESSSVWMRRGNISDRSVA